ncbi:MAG: GNAT family N-acetyltransferase [Gammaproteobacteria bacterium]|nr:GNAT family N-acetyltransferase [Gammaproteobacteria bacterium]
MTTWQWRTFQALTPDELYDILALRQEVFVIEQNCIYPDLDFKDHASLHLLGKEGDKLVSYLRLLPENVSYEGATSIGRVVTSPKARGLGLGRAAMLETLLYLKNNHNKLPIIISAQAYLQKFYESLGFQALGEQYDEDGIPHIKMRKEPT